MERNEIHESRYNARSNWVIQFVGGWPSLPLTQTRTGCPILRVSCEGWAANLIARPMLEGPDHGILDPPKAP
jgi:hypothetical protein